MAFIHVTSKEYKTFCREILSSAYSFVDGCSHGYNYASQSVHGWSLLCVCDGFKSTRNSHSWKHQNWHELQNNFHFKFLAVTLCAALGNYLFGSYLNTDYHRDFLRSEVPHYLEDVPFATRAQMQIWPDWVRSVLFWDITQHRMAYQCFRTTYQPWNTSMELPLYAV